MVHVVIATLTAKDAASRSTVMQMLEDPKEGLAKTRAFPGCQSIHARVSNDDETTIVLTEKWTERNNHKAYIAMRAKSGFFDAVGPLLAKPLDKVHSDTEVAPAPRLPIAKSAHHVVATITCIDGPARDTLIAHLEHDIEGFAKTRAFPGCLYITGHKSADDDTVLVLDEAWTSQDQHAAYMKMRQETGFFDKVGPLLAKPLDIVHSDVECSPAQMMMGVFRHGVPDFDQWKAEYVKAHEGGMHRALGITSSTVSVVHTAEEADQTIIQVVHEFPAARLKDIDAAFDETQAPFPELIARGLVLLPFTKEFSRVEFVHDSIAATTGQHKHSLQRGVSLVASSEINLSSTASSA